MRIALVGLGAIGSHAAMALARWSALTALTLVDQDRFSGDNLASQDAGPGDVGQTKTAALARRIRRLRPVLPVTGITARVESVPPGLLQADLLLGAVDSLASRQYLNEVSWVLGMSWIDGGVLGDAGLARISVFSPEPGAACLECSWNREYDILETEFPCARRGAPPTNATAALGAVAGGLLAHEAIRVVSRGRSGPGRQLVWDLSFHKLHDAALGRNPNCRFHHRRLEWEPLSLDTNLGALTGGRGAVVRTVGRERLAGRAACAACGSGRDVWRVVRAGRGALGACRSCASPLPLAGFHLTEEWLTGDLPNRLTSRPLSRFGWLRGDLLDVVNGGDARRFLLGGCDA